MWIPDPNPLAIPPGTVQWCDGQNWHDSSAPPSSSTCTKAEKGKIVDLNDGPAYCNSINWVPMHVNTGSNCPGVKEGTFRSTGGAAPITLQFCNKNGQWKTLKP